MQIDKVLTKTILTVFENLTPQPMRIYLKNNPAKFHPNPIWNDGALWFFEVWRGRANKKKKNKKNSNKMSSNMRSVPGLKIAKSQICHNVERKAINWIVIKVYTGVDIHEVFRCIKFSNRSRCFSVGGSVRRCVMFVEMFLLLRQVTSTSATLTDLRPDHWYQVRVAAVNVYGSQGWSLASAPFTTAISKSILPVLVNCNN